MVSQNEVPSVELQQPLEVYLRRHGEAISGIRTEVIDLKQIAQDMQKLFRK